MMSKKEIKVINEAETSSQIEIQSIPEAQEPLINVTEKTPTENIGNFSATIFTDNDKSEIRRYHKYLERLNKKNLINSKKAPRYKPSVAKGLTDDQVHNRVNSGYTNFTKRGSTKTIGRILFTNILTWFNILCFVAFGLLIWVGEYTSTYFLGIALLNMLIGIVQEIKAKLTIEKLSLLTSSKVTVIRMGEKREIYADDLVLDDVMVLSNGQQIPADSIVLDGMIEVNESLLTGESIPIQKKPGCSLYGGSFVVSGTAMVRINKVGKDNYVQTLARNASKYSRPKSELLGSLKLIIRTVSVVMAILGSLLVIRLVTLSTAPGSKEEVIASTIGSIIGMIPFGMFLLTSLALAVGVINLAKSRTLVQELYCIEMLARVDTLCLDKTGTITNGTMKVSEIVEIKNTTKYTIREIIASMLFALGDNNQTAIALQEHFGNQCIAKSTAILPFSSSRKLSAVSFQDEGTFVLGAPEYMFKEYNEKVDERVKRFASQGYRVLALGRASGTIKNGELPDSIKPIALITLQDQIRKEAPATIEWFKKNGVDVRVISGDNPITVSEVARRAGIANAEKYISLEGMSPVEVQNVAREYTVFGRVSPEQKLILVKELKKSGRTVAMTGDGVNDILALREADCSIAMAAGAEAARNVSHLVLLDSNFASMPKVVMQGRRVVNNIQNSSSIYLFKTLFVMLVTVFAISYGVMYPFKPVNMMLLEFFVIGIPSFFLALEINDSQIKGKFILNVLRNSFAGAVVILLNVIALFTLRDTGVIALTSFDTMAVYTITVTGLMMLWKLVKPLNLFRFCLTAAMTALVFVIGYFGRGFLEIDALTSMPLVDILILVIIWLVSYPAIAFINNSLAKLRLDKLPIIKQLNERLEK